jgi:hypothetical protein
LCVYRLITLLGDPVNAKLDERLAKLDEREKVERPWGSTSVGQSLRSGRRLKGHGVRMIP